jgi:hypothetical protein
MIGLKSGKMVVATTIIIMHLEKNMSYFQALNLREGAIIVENIQN